jgi:hypothetical protein
MINHARTLLVNTSPLRADYVDGGYDGYEYISPDFVPVRLSQPLVLVRRLLFGTSPDGLFLGLRAKELMSYIHQTELAEYVYALDPRVTYWPAMKEANTADKQRITIRQVYGDTRRIIPSGDLVSAISSGTAYRSYSVLLSSSPDTSGATVRIKTLEPPYTVSATNIVLPDAPNIPLPQNNVKIKISGTNVALGAQYMTTESNDMLIIESFEQGVATPIALESFGLGGENPATTIIAQWQIATRAKPPAAITSIIPSLEMLGEPLLLDLFGVKPKEPYTTFKNLWLDHPLPAYRLAGLTLAVIYRTNELRAKNG